MEVREEGEGPGVSLLGIQPAGAKFEVFPQVLLIVLFLTFVWDKREFILDHKISSRQVLSEVTAVACLQAGLAEVNLDFSLLLSC